MKLLDAPAGLKVGQKLVLMFGCTEDLRRVSGISAISRLGSRI